jgi:hypothetical protein
VQIVTSVSLVLTALIHLLPVVGVLGGPRLQRLYGVDVSEPNVAVMLRHRAVLFGLLGAGLLVAAGRPALHGAGLAAGLVSVGSFLALARAEGRLNPQLARVVAVDWAALALLLVGGAAWLAAGATA